MLTTARMSVLAASSSPTTQLVLGKLPPAEGGMGFTEPYETISARAVELAPITAARTASAAQERRKLERGMLAMIFEPRERVASNSRAVASGMRRQNGGGF